MRKLVSAFVLGAMLMSAASASAQTKPKAGQKSREELTEGAEKVYVPKPKFEIGILFSVEEMWRWDDKDPRFYSSFVRKIVRSLEEGPF